MIGKSLGPWRFVVAGAPDDACAERRRARPEAVPFGLLMGKTVYLTQVPGGAWRLSADDPDFERQMALAEDIMREDRDVLAALAKR